MTTCGHGLVAHVCCDKPPGWFTPELSAAVDFIGYDATPPLPRPQQWYTPAVLAAAKFFEAVVDQPLLAYTPSRPPCVHVFLGPFDACLTCGTPNPASLR